MDKYSNSSFSKAKKKNNLMQIIFVLILEHFLT